MWPNGLIILFNNWTYLHQYPKFAKHFWQSSFEILPITEQTLQNFPRHLNFAKWAKFHKSWSHWSEIDSKIRWEIERRFDTKGIKVGCLIGQVLEAQLSPSDQSHKGSTIVNYSSRVVILGNFRSSTTLKLNWSFVAEKNFLLLKWPSLQSIRPGECAKMIYSSYYHLINVI